MPARRGAPYTVGMFFQTVIQATMRLARRGLRPPPTKRDPSKGADRTGLVWVVLLTLALISAILFANFPAR